MKNIREKSPLFRSSQNRHIKSTSKSAFPQVPFLTFEMSTTMTYNQIIIMKNIFKFSITVLLISFVSSACDAQNIHPYKMGFKDYEQWNGTSPGDLSVKNFRPYRAVYSRTYTNSKGEARQDSIIMTAQKAYWYGKAIIVFEYHDAASSEYDDTNARTQLYYLDAETLELEYSIGPKSGTPEDYTIVRVMDDKITNSKIKTETGEIEFSEFSTTDPVFASRQLRFLMWSAMDLSVGKKIRLENVYFASPGAIAIDLGIVAEQVDYQAPDGTNYRPFVVDNTSNPTTATVNKYFIIDEPPYVLAQGIYDADKDEIYRWFLKLESFVFMDGK